MGRTSSASSTESAQKNTDISPISTFGAVSGKSQRGTPLCVRSLAFTMGAIGPGPDALRKNRIYKYAAALEYFFRKEVLPDDVPRLLKEGGGIDAIYVEACRDAKRSEDRGDDLGETAGALASLHRRRHRHEPTRRSIRRRRPPLCRWPTTRHPGWGTSRQALFFSNHAADTLTGALRPAKRGPLNRIDLETTLAVEKFASRLDAALHAKRLTIHAIVGAPDHRGWRQVQLVSVMTSNSLEGPWPGQTTIERDDDEPS